MQETVKQTSSPFKAIEKELSAGHRQPPHSIQRTDMVGGGGGGGQEYCEKLINVFPLLGNCFGFNSFVDALIPRISECELIWRLRLYRGNQVRMRSFRWASIQYDKHPNKRRKLGHRPTQREGDVTLQGENSHL